jgi:SAM-dependent methyltransferase
MTLTRTGRMWDALGRKDPLWAILTADDKRGNRWRIDEFFATGEREIEGETTYVRSLGIELDRRSALDFGCGVGRLTQALAKRFDVVWGVDIAASMIDLAERFNRYPSRCHYRLNTRADLKMFESGSLGFVYSNLVLQHLEPRYQRAYLKEFIRVLAPGGILLFQLPSEQIDPAGRSQSIRRRIKAVVPVPVVRAYRRLRWGGQSPRTLIELWPMPKDEVLNALKADGATVLDVRPDDSAGPNWPGFRYLVTK